MDEGKIKEAFGRVKEDVTALTTACSTAQLTAQKTAQLTETSIKETNITLNKLLKEQERITAQLTAQKTAQLTACSTAQEEVCSSLKQSEKRVLSRLERIKLKKAIQSFINQGYSTSMMKEEIISRFNIKERCFYNYLKLARELIKNKFINQSNLKS